LIFIISYLLPQLILLTGTKEMVAKKRYKLDGIIPKHVEIIKYLILLSLVKEPKHQ